MKIKIITCIMLLLNIFIFSDINVYADESHGEISQEQCLILSDYDSDICESYRTQSEIDEEITVSTNNTSSTLMNPLLSRDEDIREKETNELYFTHFFPTFLTNNGSAFDDKLFSVDSLSNVSVAILTLLSSAIGLLSMIFTYIVMLFAYLVHNNVLVDMFETLFNYINENFLGLNTSSGAAFIVVGVIGLFFMVIKVFKHLKNHDSYMEILKTVILTLVMIAFVPLSYQQIRPIEQQIYENVESMITSNLNEEDSEISLKRDIYDSFAYNSYLYRNFGTSSVEQIMQERDMDSDQYDIFIKKYLDGDKNTLKSEYESGNNYLVVNPYQAQMNLFLTLMSAIHSFLSMIIVLVPLIFLILLQLFKLIFSCFIWVTPTMMLLNKKQGSILSFFINRLSWYGVILFITFALNILLTTVLKINTVSTSQDISITILMDIVLIIMYIIVYKNKEYFIEILKNIIVNLKSIALTGDYSVSQAYSDVKKITGNYKNSVIKSFNTKMDTDKKENKTSNVKAKTSTTNSNTIRDDNTSNRKKTKSKTSRD